MARSIVPFSIALDKTFATQFASNIRREVSKVIKRNINAMASNIENHMRAIILARLSTAPEVDSIAGGELRHHFGLPDGASKISNIISNWADSIQVTPVAGGGLFLGGLDIKAIDSSYQDALGLPDSVFVTEKGTSLEWLRWLLLEGTRRIVRGYRFSDSNSSGRVSRTGRGIMIKRTSSSWGVPSQFSGTDGDNFVTRALQDVELEIEVIVRRELSRMK